MKECTITLHNPRDTYYPGETINGRADFMFDNPKNIRGISVEFKGVAEVRLGSTALPTDEEYFNITYYLLGSKIGNDINLPGGFHSYPFTCALPPTIPPSFDGKYGFIRYTVKVTLERPWEYDQETLITFTVASHLDLKASPEYRLPIHIQMEKTFCCSWCETGPLSVDVRFPASGYCCGQAIPFDIDYENKSGVDMLDIIIKLKQYVTYRSRVPSSDTNEIQAIVAEIRLGPMNGNETKHVQRKLNIPSLPPSNLSKCSIIEVAYKIKVVCNASGFHLDMDESCVITLGSAPIVDFQPPPFYGQTNNMLPDVPSGPQNAETPLLIKQHNAAPYSTQPSPGYPLQNTPYPSQGNAPYPPQCMRYSPQNTQYLQQCPYPPMNVNNMAPSAPITGNQPMTNKPNSSYPGMECPSKESQFSTPNSLDSTDNEQTQYPSYGFVLK